LLGLEIEFYICPWHKNAAEAFAPAAVLLIWIFSTPTIDVEPFSTPTIDVEPEKGKKGTGSEEPVPNRTDNKVRNEN
jgi:hypothetical protein